MNRRARVQRNIDAVEYLRGLEEHGKGELPRLVREHPGAYSAWRKFRMGLSPSEWSMVKLEIQTELAGMLAKVFEGDVATSKTDEVNVLVCKHCGGEFA